MRPRIKSKINMMSRALWRLKPRQTIARPPRMLANEFEAYTPTEGRVMARYGIRSPSGLKRAMRAHGVDSVEDLIRVLEHHKARRRFWHRLYLMYRRAVGGYTYQPHAREIRESFRARAATPQLDERIKAIKAAQNGGGS